MPNFKFKKVKTLPTSGYSTGDIYFVSSEKKIYIRTESGWEDYGGASGGVTSLGGKTGDILLDTGADGSKRIGFEIETVPAAGGGKAKTLVGKLPTMKTVNGQSLFGSGDITVSGGSGSGISSADELHASLAAGETPIDVKLDEDRTTISVEYESGDTYEGAGMVFTKFVNANSQGQSSHEEYITDICGKGITVKTKESDGSITDKTAITGDKISTGSVDAEFVTLTGEITQNTQAANKKYVDDQIAAKLGTVLTQLQAI